MRPLDNIIPLPCGCAVEMQQTNIEHHDFDDIHAECPWCAATFELTELQNWLMNTNTVLLLQESPPVLVKYGDKIFEAHGRCGCGSPLVCEPGNKTKIHLDELPQNPIEVARN